MTTYEEIRCVALPCLLFLSLYAYFKLISLSNTCTLIASSTEDTLDGDYKRTSTTVTLNANDTSGCVPITLLNDTIVETTEMFLVQVEQTVSSDVPVFELGIEFTEIRIIDDDGLLCIYI